MTRLATALAALGALVLPATVGRASAGDQDTPSMIRACKYPAVPDRRWNLPPSLREISGLAWYGNALLAHQDESGRLFRIDPVQGSVTNWSVLERSVRDDFEGLAIIDSAAWLMTSRGRLYSFPARTSERPLPWRMVETGLGKSCELEGLAALPDGVLLLPCKAGVGDDVVIYRWDTRTGKLATPASIRVAAAALAKAGVRRIRPSAIEWDAASRHLLVVSSSPAMLLELDGGGSVVALVNLKGHPQPEGLALSPTRTLYVGDEGGQGRGSLSRYTCGA